MGQNPPLDHEVAGSQYWPCRGESWSGVTRLRVQVLVLGIKKMEQGVSPPSPQQPQQLQMLEESLVGRGTASVSGEGN